MALKKEYSYDDLIKMPISELKQTKKLYRDDVTRNLRKLRKAGVIATPATLGLQRALQTNKHIKPYNISLDNLQAPTSKPSTTRPHYKLSPQQERANLIHEIIESQQYLTAKTGTVKGFTSYEADTNERLGGSYADADADIKRRYWKLYEEEREFIESNKLSSDQLQKDLSEYFIGSGYKYITQKRRDWFEDLVNNAYDQANGISGDTTKTPFNI